MAMPQVPSPSQAREGNDERKPTNRAKYVRTVMGRVMWGQEEEKVEAPMFSFLTSLNREHMVYYKGSPLLPDMKP